MPVLDEAVSDYARAIDAPLEDTTRELASWLSQLAAAVAPGSVPVPDQDVLKRIDTGSSTGDPAVVVPWLTGDAAWHRMRSTAVGLGQAARRAGVSDSALRRVIGAGTGPDVELLGCKDRRGHWRVFAYQIPIPDGHGGEPISRAGRRAQRALPPGMHPVAVAAWWDAPNPALSLDGRELTPRRWISEGFEPDAVIAAATHEDAV